MCRSNEGHNQPVFVSLRVHVPKQYILWPQSTNIDTTLRLKYILLGCMDSFGFSCL